MVSSAFYHDRRPSLRPSISPVIDLTDRLRRVARRLGLRSASRFAPHSPTYIFHHIPKCGGTSIHRILGLWFVRVLDYRRGWTLDYPPAVDLDSLGSLHCLCGHFELDGHHLHQRYPEALRSDRFRIFTFVRDPLELQLSLFRYESRHGVAKARSVEEHLQLRPNYLAKRLPAGEDDFEEVLDRYFFVGILERAQESLDLLASMLGRSRRRMPWANRTQTGRSDAATARGLGRKVVEKFREANCLDYAIYEHCQKILDKGLKERKIAAG